MQLSFLKNVHFVDQENTSKISVILEVDPSMILKVVKNTILGATPKILSLKIHQHDRTDNLKKFLTRPLKELIVKNIKMAKNPYCAYLSLKLTRLIRRPSN